MASAPSACGSAPVGSSTGAAVHALPFHDPRRLSSLSSRWRSSSSTWPASRSSSSRASCAVTRLLCGGPRLVATAAPSWWSWRAAGRLRGRLLLRGLDRLAPRGALMGLRAR
eukprot:8161907-Heterocapsa_arctica.AAC.1